MKVSETRKRAEEAGADLPGTMMHATWRATLESLDNPVFIERGLPYKADEAERDELSWAGQELMLPIIAVIEATTSRWYWPIVRRWYSVRRTWRRIVLPPVRAAWQKATE